MKSITIIVSLLLSAGINAQSAKENIPYGNNPVAGHYYKVGDAKLYYEIYRAGAPIVLLHGGVYGYIDEFAPFIEKLKDSYKVICIATRGHGKSEMGAGPFSYKQRAQDAYSIVRSITADSVIVLGFSDGGYSAYKLAAAYPDLVKKLIVIGAGDFPKINNRPKYNYNADSLLKEARGFFEKRISLMPEPKRWNENLRMLSNLYNNDFVSEETLSKIKCATLVMGGDNDGYSSPATLLKAADYIPDSRLSIIPGCGHVVFFCNFPAVWASIAPFLKNAGEGQ